MRVCSIKGCNGKYLAKGLCAKHYHNQPKQQKKRKIYQQSDIGKTNKKKYLSLPRVKKSRRNQKLLRKFGITLKEYNQMVKDQDNKCAICGKGETCVDPKTHKIKVLSVDHDHITGKVRELLCSNCNTALGLFFDNPTIILLSLKYILKHGGKME